jgi:threonyl-tRNA synthetase
LKRIPYLLIVGEQEAENQSVSVRKQGEGDKGSMDLQGFADFINNEVKEQLSSLNN